MLDVLQHESALLSGLPARRLSAHMPGMPAHREVGAHSQHDVIAAGDVKQLVTLLHELLHSLLDIDIVQAWVILQSRQAQSCSGLLPCWSGGVKRIML